MAGANQTPLDGTTPQPGLERSLPILAPYVRRIYIRPSGGLAFGSVDGHATSNRRIVGEIAPKFARELPLRPHLKIYKEDTGLLSEYYTRVAASVYVDKNAPPVQVASRMSLQRALLLRWYQLKRQRFNELLLSENPIRSISSVDWNALVQHWKVSHGHLLSGLPAGGTVNPEGGTPMPKESHICSMSNAELNKLLEHWSLYPEDGQLLYGLAAAGTFNPENGTAMPKESLVSSISSADWNTLVQHWKVSHGHLLSDLPAGGTLNPEAGTTMPKESPVRPLDDCPMLHVLPSSGAFTPEGGKSMISAGPRMC